MDINTFLITLFSSTAVAGGIAYILKKSYEKLLDFKMSQKIETLKNELSLKNSREIEKYKDELKLKTTKEIEEYKKDLILESSEYIENIKTEVLLKFEKELHGFKSKTELENAKLLSKYTDDVQQKSKLLFEDYRNKRELAKVKNQQIFETQFQALTKITAHVYRVRNFYKEIDYLIEKETQNDEILESKITSIRKKRNVETLDYSDLRQSFLSDQTDELLYGHRLVLGDLLFSLLHDFKHLEYKQDHILINILDTNVTAPDIARQ